MFNSNNIRAEMARHNKTARQLSQELGISSNSLSFKLTGKREFTLSELQKIADVFNCSIDYLVGRVQKSTA